ncbi:nucleotide-diphospho-sugar transferase [Dipodascopsis uninucleata]
MPRGSTLRIIRLLAIAIVLLVIVYKVATPSSLDALSHAAGYHEKTSDAVVADTKKDEKTTKNEKSDPVKDENKATHKEDKSKSFDDKKSGGEKQSTDIKNTESYGRVNATFVTLARNEDLWSIVKSIRHVEDRFNHKFNYDWVFLNDNEFDDNFKEVTTALISGKTKYGKIPSEHWGFPEWIDRDKAAKVREEMREKKIIYGDSISYRHMCRFESGFFFQHELMKNYKYYWRVEPDIILHCDIDYDVFKFMEANQYDYGFTISLYEYIETIPTLWDSVKKFMKDHPNYIAKDNLMGWLSDDNGETYNKCHFWSNFEVGNLDFWRSKAYMDFFNFLDKEGGFFYERWGDAPVHSIAAGLFLPKSKVHYFEDIGYWHVPFANCPTNKEDRLRLKCVCNPQDNFSWKGYSCTPKYFNIMEIKRPSEWHLQS